MPQAVFIASGEIQQLADLYAIGPADLERVQAIGESIAPKIEQHVGRFYDWLARQPEYPQFFTSEEILERVKRDQAIYWQEFFGGRLDAPYVERRRSVGEVHARIGLPLPTYFASMNLMLEIFADGAAPLASDDRAAAVSSLAKLIHLDTSLVVETFSRITSETIAEQSRSLIAMSTPVTAIWRDILLLPIVGVVDSRRAQEIMSAMLAKISDTQSKAIILDISGVAVVDTAVANHLIKITKATKLMGCECTISGVSPAIAQTVVELGIDVGEIQTTANLRDALGMAFDRVGASLADRG
jgi:rsbT co-antagonist protein RsbR